MKFTVHEGTGKPRDDDELVILLPTQITNSREDALNLLCWMRSNLPANTRMELAQLVGTNLLNFDAPVKDWMFGETTHSTTEAADNINIIEEPVILGRRVLK